MPASEDLEVIRELLAAGPPSQDVNEHVRARLNAVIAAVESHPPPGLIDHVLAEDGARAPAGMTRRVARWCRRRLALRPVAGVAVLAAGAVALAVLGVPGAGHGGAGRPAVNTAYVAKRVDGALRAAGPGEIAHVTFTLFHSGGSTTGEEWSYGDRWREVSYSRTGHMAYDQGSTAASVFTQVNYLARTWSRGPVQGIPVLLPDIRAMQPVTRGCGSMGSASVVRALRVGVFCVSLTEAGRQRVDGVDAIELRGRDSRVFETIWVSPGTYLPLRVVIRPASGGTGPSQEADITWLKPTRQNLAKLTVPVPAGFRQVPPSAMTPPSALLTPHRLRPGPGATGASSSAVRRQPVSPAASG